MLSILQTVQGKDEDQLVYELFYNGARRLDHGVCYIIQIMNVYECNGKNIFIR